MNKLEFLNIYIYKYEYLYVLLKHLQSMGIDDQLPRIPQGFQMCQGY